MQTTAILLYCGIAGAYSFQENLTFTQLPPLNSKLKVTELCNEPALAAHCLDYSADGKQLSIGFAKGIIRVLDGSNGKSTADWKAHPNDIMRILIHPRTSQLVSQAANSNDIKLTDFQLGSDIWAITPHITSLHGFTFDPNGQLLATCGTDKGRDFGSVKLWDVRTGVLKKSISGMSSFAGVKQVAFSPNGKRLAFAVPRRVEKRVDSDVVIWDVEKHVEVRKIEAAIQVGSSANWIWFSSDSKSLITAGITRASLWNVDTCDNVRQFPNPVKTNTYQRSYSPKADLLATSYSDEKLQKIVLMSPNRPEITYTFEGMSGPVSISPDGTRLAFVHRQRLRIWSLEIVEK